MPSDILDVVDLGSDGAVALILNRPAKRNAFSVELLGELAQALDRLASRRSCRVIVLSARGPMFSAGADMNDERANAIGEPGSSEALLGECMRRIAAAPQPMVARVHGDLYGGAIGLVAACDLVVASTGAHFTFTEARIGLAPTLAAEAVIARIGHAAAMRAFLLGERIDGAFAERIGLATISADLLSIDDEIARILTALLASSPSGLAATKALVRAYEPQGRKPDIATLYELTRNLVGSAEAQEGAEALMARRPPIFAASAPTALELTRLFEGSPVN